MLRPCRPKKDSRFQAKKYLLIDGSRYSGVIDFPLPVPLSLPLPFLIIFAGGLLLLAGLTLLALQRRNEILRELLTPEEPEIEKEFFKRRQKIEAEQPSNEEPSTENTSEPPTSDETSAWGTAEV